MAAELNAREQAVLDVLRRPRTRGLDGGKVDDARLIVAALDRLAAADPYCSHGNLAPCPSCCESDPAQTTTDEPKILGVCRAQGCDRPSLMTPSAIRIGGQLCERHRTDLPRRT